MHFPCFCILEMEHMTLLQRDRENIELGQLITVMVADKLHMHQYIRSLKPLIA